MDASEIKPSGAFLRLKVNELKEICLAGGLSRQGRKAELQQRILTAVQHGGRVQQALERLLPNNLPFAHAAPPAQHHHGGASGSAIGRPLVPTSTAGGMGTGTAELRCPCGAHGRCNPEDPSARLVRCVACTAHLHCACLGLHEAPRDFVCERCRSEQLDPFHPAATTCAPAGSSARREGPWSCLIRPSGHHAQIRLALSAETLRALSEPVPLAAPLALTRTPTLTTTLTTTPTLILALTPAPTLTLPRCPRCCSSSAASSPPAASTGGRSGRSPQPSALTLTLTLTHTHTLAVALTLTTGGHSGRRRRSTAYRSRCAMCP